MSRRAALGLAVLGLGLLAARTAMAFVLLEPPRRWFQEDLPRNVVVDGTGLATIEAPDPDAGVSATIGAVESWNDAGVEILAGSTAAPQIVLGDGISQLVFDDPLHACNGLCLAATFTGFFDADQIGSCDSLDVVAFTDADIVFNTSPSGPSNGWTSQAEDPGGSGCLGEFFVEAVAAHEIGHLIGLGHSEDGSALMAATIAPCDPKVQNADDLSARDTLYVCGGDPPACPGDLSMDMQVDAVDLAQLLAAWGANPGAAADLNGDDTVDAADLAQLLAAWGPCP